LTDVRSSAFQGISFTGAALVVALLAGGASQSYAAPDSTSHRGDAVRLAQAPADTPPGTLSDSPAPPPRFRDMQVNELPPLTPAAPAQAAPEAAPPASGAAAGAQARPAAGAAGFWVQLGAFGQREGAAGFQDKVAKQMPALAGKLAVFSDNGRHRLQAGPYASREAALRLGAQLRSSLGLAPVIVERR